MSVSSERLHAPMNWAVPAVTYSGACLQNNFEVAFSMDLDGVKEPCAPLQIGLTTNNSES